MSRKSSSTRWSRAKHSCRKRAAVSATNRRGGATFWFDKVADTCHPFATQGLRIAISGAIAHVPPAGGEMPETIGHGGWVEEIRIRQRNSRSWIAGLQIRGKCHLVVPLRL